MKITRMKKGYIIRLSDGEMEALRLLHRVVEIPDEFSPLVSLGAVRALRGRLSLHAAFDTDEDRRGPKENATHG